MLKNTGQRKRKAITSITRRIELSANLAIIIVACALLTILVKQYYFDRRPTEIHRIRAGDRLSSLGVNWAKNEQTLLIALQPGCPFCAESANFYQRLRREIEQQRKPHVVALFDKAEKNSESYVKELGVPFDDILTTSFKSEKITGTPTLLLVDGTGVVDRVWFGKLSSDQEKEVIDYLR